MLALTLLMWQTHRTPTADVSSSVSLAFKGVSRVTGNANYDTAAQTKGDL